MPIIPSNDVKVCSSIQQGPRKLPNVVIDRITTSDNPHIEHAGGEFKSDA